MARTQLKVYLDHHIRRENLLYRRNETSEEPRVGDEERLKIEHLTDGDSALAYLLRKPDFQRATSAWSPEECVSLLESFLYG